MLIHDSNVLKKSLERSNSNSDSKVCALYYLSVAYEKMGDAEQATKVWIEAEVIADRLIGEHRHLHCLKDAEAPTKFTCLLRPSARFSGSALNETMSSRDEAVHKGIEFQHREIQTLAVQLGNFTSTRQIMENEHQSQPTSHPILPTVVRPGLPEPILRIVDLPKPGYIVPENQSRDSNSISTAAKVVSTLGKGVRATADASTAAPSNLLPGLALGVAGTATTLTGVNVFKTFQQVELARRQTEMAETVGKENLKLIKLQKTKTRMDIKAGRKQKSKTALDDDKSGTDDGDGDSSDDADNGDRSENVFASSTNTGGRLADSSQRGSVTTASKFDKSASPIQELSKANPESSQIRQQKELAERRKRRMMEELARATVPKVQSHPEESAGRVEQRPKAAIGPNEKRLNARIQKENHLAGASQFVLSEHLEKPRKPASEANVDASTKSVTEGDSLVDLSSQNTVSVDSSPSSARGHADSELYDSASQGVTASGERPESRKPERDSNRSEHTFEGLQVKKEVPGNRQDVWPSPLSAMANVEFEESEMGTKHLGYGPTDIQLVDLTSEVSVSKGDRGNDSGKSKSGDVKAAPGVQI
jgi:hypothetical protein